MKAGVEDGDLRHWPQQFRDNLHTLKFSAIVERREDGNAFDRRLDLSGNERRLEMLRTAVNDAVSDNVDIGRAGNRLRGAVPQAIEQALDRFSARTRRSHFFPRDSTGVPDRKPRLLIDPFNLPLPIRSGRLPRKRISN